MFGRGLRNGSGTGEGVERRFRLVLFLQNEPEQEEGPSRLRILQQGTAQGRVGGRVVREIDQALRSHEGGVAARSSTGLFVFSLDEGEHLCGKPPIVRGKGALAGCVAGFGGCRRPRAGVALAEHRDRREACGCGERDAQGRAAQKSGVEGVLRQGFGL